MSGAAAPASASARSTAAPAVTARRPLAGIAEARVDRALEQVRRRVDADVGDPDRQRAAMDERIVARVDRLHEQAPEPGPGEDGLGDDRAGEQGPGLEAGHGGDGEERVAQRVHRDHATLGRALVAGDAHEVLAERSVHAIAYQADEDGRHAEPEGRRGEYQ